MKHVNKIFRIALSLLFVALLNASCKKDNSTINEEATCLSLSTDVLVFHGEEELNLTIQNNGSEQWKWKVSSDLTNLHIDYSSDELAPGETETFRIFYNRNRSDIEVHRKNLVLTSNLGYVVINLISFPENVENQCYVNKQIYFPQGVDSFKFPIDNSGSTSISYSISSSSGQVELPSASGTIQPYGRAEVVVNVKNPELWQGNNSVELHVNYGSVVDMVRLSMEKKHILDGHDFCAAYSKTANRLVLVSDDDKLLVYNSENHSFDVLKVSSYYPFEITLSIDGSRALVKTENSFVYVNLEDLYVIDEFRFVGVDHWNVENVVLGQNGWAYFIFDDYLYCSDLNSANHEVVSTGENVSNLTMHPSGNYMYSLQNSMVIQYACHDGEVELLNRFEFIGDYYSSDILYFSQQGDKIFAKNGTVYQFADGLENNLVFLGQVEFDAEEDDYQPYRYECVDYNESNHSLYLVEEDAYNRRYPHVYVSSLDDFQPAGSIFPEPLITMDGSGMVSTQWDMIPKYVFVNAEGSKLYMISYHDYDFAPWTLEIIDL